MPFTVTKCTCSKGSARQWIKNNLLIIATICAIVLGLVIGFGLRPLNLSSTAIAWIGIWGELFLRMLKMIILPLIVCCLVVGVASMEITSSGKVGAVTLTYIFSTQFLSTLLGLVLVLAIKPGAGFGDTPPGGMVGHETSYTDVFSDLFRNLLPENIVQACIQTAYTDVRTDIKEALDSTYNTTDTNSTHSPAIKKLKYRDRMNVIGIVTFSIALGLSISAAGDAGEPLYRFFTSLNAVITKLMNAIIMYSPIGITSLIASSLVQIKDMETSLQAVGLMVCTCVVGSMIHMFLVLPVLYVIFCRKNPYKYFLGISDAYFASLAPPSSAAALPYLLKNCPEKLGVDKRIAQFVIPVEVTINRDGSALFIYVAISFVAQSYSIVLTAGEQIILVLLVAFLVAAAAVVPSSSIVVVMMLSAAVGVPVDERIGLLMMVEWLTDRVRTGTNVVSHGFGCAIIDGICKRYLNVFNSPEDDIESEQNRCGEHFEKEELEILTRP